MATIIGGVFTSHVPAIGGAIARGVQSEPYWKPFFDAFPPIRDWLATARPDVVVTAYNDHGLNFFLDRMPTFAVGAADEYRNADEGWGIPSVPPFAGDAGLSWHLVEQLVAQDFDPVTCQEMLVDHAFTLPMALLWPDQRWPARVVPVCVNTVQFPLPSAARCPVQQNRARATSAAPARRRRARRGFRHRQCRSPRGVAPASRAPPSPWRRNWRSRGPECRHDRRHSAAH